MGSLSDGILAEGRIVASVTKQLEQKMSKFLTETLQVTSMGVFFGAVVGSAVATGVIVGMLSVAAVTTSGIVIAGGSTGSGTTDGGSGREAQKPNKYSSLPRLLYKCIPRYLVGQQGAPSNSVTGIVDSKESPNQSTDTQQPEQAKTASAVEISSTIAAGPLVMLQAHPVTTHIDATAQCSSCLEQLEASLTHHGLVWVDIRRLTVYLVSGRCNATTFRNTLDKMNLQHQPLISILYVQQLEDEDVVLQIEAMACKNN